MAAHLLGLHNVCCLLLLYACRAPDPDHLARSETVLQQLADLARQAQLAAAGPLLDWLRILTQLQLPEQRQQQERQRLLRAVVDVRAQMQVGCSTVLRMCCGVVG